MLCIPQSISYFIGSNSEKGTRPTQEDEHIILENCENQIPNKPYQKATFVGVYDGHGGKYSSIFAKKNLHLEIFSNLRKGDEEASITEALRNADGKLLDELRVATSTSGTCVVAALILDGVLYMINSGDSEAVLYKSSASTEVITLTTIHQPQSGGSEEKRIHEMGGCCFFGRVFGQLAVSRALGDPAYKIPNTIKDYVIPDPAINKVVLDDSCKFIIIACDGLWDVCTYDKAANLVNQWISEGHDMDTCARKLVNWALDHHTTDNVTVSIIGINTGSAAQKKPQGRSMSLGCTTSTTSTTSTSTSTSTTSTTSTSTTSTTYTTTLTKAPSPKPIYIKSLIGFDLDRSYFYLGSDQARFCAVSLKCELPLPCWIEQEFMSRIIFPEKGVDNVKKTEAHHGEFFVWATEFSNVHNFLEFNEKSITIDGVEYPGPEHYFQLQKSKGTVDEEKAKNLMKNSDSYQAWQVGNSLKVGDNWDKEKDDVMLTALRAKFSQNEEVRNLLAETVGKKLVQLKPNDSYWGTGPDGKGLNQHANLLTIIRSELCENNSEQVEPPISPSEF